MTNSLDTSEREAEEPRMLRLPVVEMAAEPAPPPVAANYEPHPLGTAERIRRLERMNAKLVEALTLMVRTHDEPAETLLQEAREQQWLAKARAALTSATKEQQK